MTKTKVLIVDDHALVRAGLSALLTCQKDLSVIGEAEDGLTAIEAVRTLSPDVVIMDLMMPGMDGSEATRRIIRESPNARILILTSFGNAGELAAALDAGATGVILKDARNNDVIEAIRAVARGEKVIPPEIRTAVAETDMTTGFTPRQLEILHSVTRGLSNPEIARQFGISANGVKGHLSVIFEKLGAANRTEAIAIALRKHLLKI